jgi:hypothetical protein
MLVGPGLAKNIRPRGLACVVIDLVSVGVSMGMA